MCQVLSTTLQRADCEGSLVGAMHSQAHDWTSAFQAYIRGRGTHMVESSSALMLREKLDSGLNQVSSEFVLSLLEQTNTIYNVLHYRVSSSSWKHRPSVCTVSVAFVALQTT